MTKEESQKLVQGSKQRVRKAMQEFEESSGEFDRKIEEMLRLL